MCDIIFRVRSSSMTFSCRIRKYAAHFLKASASTFRWQCTRQRCQVVDSIRAVAALMPAWASLVTSYTPLRPRRTRSRRTSVQKVSASDGPMLIPIPSRRPSIAR